MYITLLAKIKKNISDNIYFGKLKIASNDAKIDIVCLRTNNILRKIFRQKILSDFVSLLAF